MLVPISTTSVVRWAAYEWVANKRRNMVRAYIPGNIRRHKYPRAWSGMQPNFSRGETDGVADHRDVRRRAQLFDRQPAE